MKLSWKPELFSLKKQLPIVIPTLGVLKNRLSTGLRHNGLCDGQRFPTPKKNARRFRRGFFHSCPWRRPIEENDQEPPRLVRLTPTCLGRSYRCFTHKETGEPIRDASLMEKIVHIFQEEGSDAWFKPHAKERFLEGTSYHPDDYDQVMDILDVWFDSGTTHAHVLEAREEQTWPADLYLEGSDQHRGWFQSSALEAVATRQRPPYKAVLTHGFTLDEKGRKMSKSLGNIIAPLDICQQYGADTLRLWVALADFFTDLRLGKNILTQTADIYRRLRNTLRFLLGNLTPLETPLPHEKLLAEERYILDRLHTTGKAFQEHVKHYRFHDAILLLFDFCNEDLSAFYFDVRKDVLYCDSQEDLSYQSTQTALYLLFEHLCAYLAPFLPFTTEEAYRIAHKEENLEETSIHLTLWKDPPQTWQLPVEEKQAWQKLLLIRRVALSALEESRQKKEIGAALSACLTLYLPQDWHKEIFPYNLADLLLVSSVSIESSPPPKEAFQLKKEGKELDVAVLVTPQKGLKCERCWRVDPKTDTLSMLCPRCQRVVQTDFPPDNTPS